MATFDLTTRVIPDDHSIWALHSGRRKRQYSNFNEFNCVFLEVPGFSATPSTFDSIETIRQHLRMSDSVKQYCEGRTDTPPSYNPNTYGSGPANREIARERGFNSAIGNVRSLYKEAKVGDLVMVPGVGQYAGVLIGEFTSEFSPRDEIRVVQFDEESVPIRKVKWISKSIEKRRFSRAISRGLENRHAIINLNEGVNSSLNDISMEVYQRVYDNFTIAGRSKATFFGERYNSRDPEGIIASATIIKYFYSAYLAAELGRQQEFANLSYERAIAEFYDPAAVQDFSFNFNSPGAIKVAINTMGAVFVVLVIAVALDNISFSEATNNLNVTNGGGTIELPELRQSCDLYRGIMQSIGEEGFEKVRTECMSARSTIGLDTPVRRTE